MSKKVGVCPEEQALPYYKYYAQPMAAIPEEKLAILAAGPSPVPGVPLEQRNQFLLGRDTEFCQTGFGVHDNGTGFVCNTTYMPGVTGEMLDWWFPWHSVGADLRYKLWDPEDHYFARADNVDYVCDPAVPMREKTWGVTHYILEDIGSGMKPLVLHFQRPRDLGLDESYIGTGKCQSLVCSMGESGSVMIHKWYPYEDGVLFCSRFWMGYVLQDGQIVKALPEGVRMSMDAPRGLFAHNIKEFTNLAAVLPAIYAEQKDAF
jgi:hypothetical protein